MRGGHPSHAARLPGDQLRDADASRLHSADPPGREDLLLHRRHRHGDRSICRLPHRSGRLAVCRNERQPVGEQAHAHVWGCGALPPSGHGLLGLARGLEHVPRVPAEGDQGSQHVHVPWRADHPTAMALHRLECCGHAGWWWPVQDLRPVGQRLQPRGGSRRPVLQGERRHRSYDGATRLLRVQLHQPGRPERQPHGPERPLAADGRAGLPGPGRDQRGLGHLHGEPRHRHRAGRPH
mmetsp:Transcript_177435/g.431613  ORF Transcript_177435/g.431613 Transcript_177435/m.431613 type:complete len:237 (-) Transcript_177435:1823-2533(-)